jgi:hypothetical protein
MCAAPEHTSLVKIAQDADDGYSLLQKKLLRACLFNFLILSLVGLLLRAWTIFGIPYLSYKNVLHAHSHFAFGGWVMPALILVLLKIFPELCNDANFSHWKKCVTIILVSAYGMLISFPFQGYGSVSILFSTLSIAGGFYAGYLVSTAPGPAFFHASRAFLKAAFFFFYLSSIGPFATGPLIAMGKAGSPIYFNAIYFYLHFQYNGFFTFIVLAVLYKIVERNKPFNNGRKAFNLFAGACVPAYFLSVLWTQPGIFFYILGGLAAAVQIIGLHFIVKDISGIRWKSDKGRLLFRIAISAFLLKNILQLLSAVPAIAQLVCRNRNFIIAYLHLVLIGFISLFVFAVILRNNPVKRSCLVWTGVRVFLFGFVSTELLLVLQAAGWLVFLPSLFYLQLLFALSILFPVALLIIWRGTGGLRKW